MNNTDYSSSTLPAVKHSVELKPKLGGFLATYILFSLPGFLISCFALLLVCIFVLTGIASAFVPADEMSELEYNILKDGYNSSAVLVYDLTGAIQTGTSTLPDSSRALGIYTEIVDRDFDRIKEDDSIKSVVFRLNTPGGSVFASEVLGDQIQDLMNAKGQETAVFYYDQIVASGGLWSSLKVPNYIVGSQYGQTGSIGVVVSLPNYAGLAEKVGYKETVIKSSSSKDYGNPLRDIAPEEQAFIQGQVDDQYNTFVSIVAKGRSIPEEKVRTFADGFVYPNAQAQGFGLIDELGTIEAAYTKSAELAELGSDYSVRTIQTTAGVLDSFFARTDATVAKFQPIDLTLQLEPGTLYAIDESRAKIAD